ncbi:MAG: type VI secretion system Vgr family protein [Planctomycetota bacterium]|jgi:type VI secretion system secreted protein VgrG
MALKQQNRLLNLQTPLGENVLLLTGFRGREAISEPFKFHLDLISDNSDVSAKQIVGRKVTFSIESDESPRYFNGFVSRFCAGDEDQEGRRHYRAEVVPWLWFLTRNSDCRIFQHKTAPQIIEQVFQDLDFRDYEISQIQGKHPEREYCVQYRETDFAFVSRLMEQEGIFYYFRHEQGRHVLVLGDQKGAYHDCVENEVDYPWDYGSRAMADHITRWEHRYEFRSGKLAQTDYNFIDHPARREPTPSKLLLTEERTLVDLDGVDKYELFDYPGGYKTKDEGAAYTRVRIEEEETGHDVVHAAGNCRTFTPGGKFRVREHRSKSEQGKRFVITSVRHDAAEPKAYETGAPAADDYHNTFTCIPDSVTFRPACTTPKPIVHGPQTAVVVGVKGGNRIYSDGYGRVKVQFFWDREGKRDENSSCWIRVAQVKAGKGWGAMSLPHVGNEVIVGFLDGDPDRPIMLGSVYNGENLPPLRKRDAMNRFKSGAQ